MTDVIEQGGQWDCTNAEDFLDKLSLRKPQWRSQPAKWLFRGQPGDFPLRPKAYRDDGKWIREIGIPVYIKPGAKKPSPSAYNTAMKALMTRFQGHLNDAGIAIPAPSPLLFEPVAADEKPLGKLSEQAKPSIALAQHIGLPTPLLDWTTRPFVAAYFALPAEPSDTTPIVVWALNSEVLPARYELEEAGIDHKQGFMKVETAPRSSNPNLHAQSGVFTVIDGELGSEYTVDEYVLKVAVGMSQHINDQLGYPFMRKLTLLGTCGRELQRLLFEEGITGSSMFPGVEGVVRSMKERAVWSKA